MTRAASWCAAETDRRAGAAARGRDGSALPAREPTDDERAAVDALLGPPASQWDGGERRPRARRARGDGGHVGTRSGTCCCRRCTLCNPGFGWISEGALIYMCERLTVPPAEALACATFYALLATRHGRGACCTCATTLPADAVAPRRSLQSSNTRRATRTRAVRRSVILDPDEAAWLRSPCLGLCDQAPAAMVQVAGDPATSDSSERRPRRRARAPCWGAMIGRPRCTAPDLPQQGDPALRLLERVGVVDPTSLDEYRACGRYEALRRAFELGPTAVLREVIDSKLLGRGGRGVSDRAEMGRRGSSAGAPTLPDLQRGRVRARHVQGPGAAWRTIPFALVESMTIAGLRDRRRTWVHLHAWRISPRDRRGCNTRSSRRGPVGCWAPTSWVRVGSTSHRGAAAAPARTSAAKRRRSSIPSRDTAGEPRNKPPFPMESGLFAKPTVVNNVETLANIPCIVLGGGAGVRGDRHARNPPGRSSSACAARVSGRASTKCPLARHSRDLLALAGGIPGGRTMQAILLGGAAGLFVRPDELEIRLTFEGTREARATLGSGVIMVFDDRVDLPDASAPHRRLLPRRILRPVRALPRGHGPAGRGIVSTSRVDDPAATVADEVALLAEIGMA